MRDENLTRRTFLQALAVAVPAGAVMLHGESQAADLVNLDVNEPTAKAGGYVEEAASVETAATGRSCLTRRGSVVCSRRRWRSNL